MFASLLRSPARRFTPAQTLILGYAVIVVVGAGLLLLPAATPHGDIRWVDAIFTATSATSMTGLIVRDTATEFTLFGQLVILGLIQIGGLGYTTAAALLVTMLGRRVGMRGRLVLQEALKAWNTEGLLRFVMLVIGITFAIEAVGAVVLTFRFLLDYEWPRAVHLGVFHAVSAFNNAGFSAFSNSLGSYQLDLVVNLAAGAMIVLGGLGFLVYGDVASYMRGQKYLLSVHTKMVLVVTAVLIVLGTLVILLFEQANPRTLGILGWPEKILVAGFQVVSARTAGFNTIDLSVLANASLYFIVFLMFVGGSPGGTGGGIKTTTLGAIAAAMWATMRGRQDVTVFHRRLPPDVIAKAFYLAGLAIILISIATLVLDFVENRDFLGILFEVTSAATTVGLSTGDGGSRSLSALFSDFGKLVISLLMFVGRFGPLAVSIAVLGGARQPRFRHAEEKMVIG